MRRSFKVQLEQRYIFLKIALIISDVGQTNKSAALQMLKKTFRTGSCYGRREWYHEANSRTTYIHLTNRNHSASNIRDINNGKQVIKLNLKYHRNDYDFAFFFFLRIMLVFNSYLVSFKREKNKNIFYDNIEILTKASTYVRS